jgi:iron-sulfur cluster assembly protein
MASTASLFGDTACLTPRGGDREEWHEREALLAARAQHLVVDAPEVNAVPVLNAHDGHDLLRLFQVLRKGVGDAQVPDQAGLRDDDQIGRVGARARLMSSLAQLRSRRGGPRRSSEAGSGGPAVGTASRIARSTVEELVMLTLTDGAVSAIRSLTSQPELPVQTGLRIVAQGEGEASLQLALVDGPVAGDQVVEEAGARVFVEPVAAAVLEDKALDAEMNEQGSVAFSVCDQAPPA